LKTSCVPIPANISRTRADPLHRAVFGFAFIVLLFLSAAGTGGVICLARGVLGLAQVLGPVDVVAPIAFLVLIAALCVVMLRRPGGVRVRAA
jgi:hypothetical protein